ncbi:hypothetical protein Noc_1824 [Nitrosococcus oceani ATCC 19707]|uniref:Uncharacterized protein n=2 Tax=Nitrosococcus oceani TaxID=1229 RepID=Q3JA54_NITOC|nr:hypothetical protein [Nitrosococcus oceani]ABA58292.1 hypothetical protein Noc_1824 [Nitrosococcus oceani ATCC 19707]EDZ68354.1 hypothetical protein NOC27_1681 [Nitrosococcus oceani AFC27]KFI19221.1 hypothetical protein IB75_09695 [Nitrosococcus oceani C-27]GEM18676.1 hypothetical protein NONS58_00320 [Nitrosococcus oceani]
MKSITLLLLVGLGGFVLYGNAYALNAHAYNGSYCDNYHGAEVGDFTRGFNGIKNNANAGRYISCPVLVDESGNIDGTDKVALYYTGTGTVSCVLFSQNADGSTRQSRTASRTNSGWLSIPNITDDDYWGSYSMYCYLPPQGVLNTIWVGETNVNR